MSIHTDNSLQQQSKVNQSFSVKVAIQYSNVATIAQSFTGCCRTQQSNRSEMYGILKQFNHQFKLIYDVVLVFFILRHKMEQKKD